MGKFVLGAITALVAVIISSWAFGDEDLLCIVLQNPELCGKVGWLQATAWAAAVIIAIVGVLEIRNRSQQARAEFLLELHVQWQQLTASRDAFNTLKSEVSDAVEQANPGLGEAALQEKKRNAYEPKLNTIYKGEQKRYRLLMKLFSFFENMGYMVKRNYISEADVIALYKGPILDMGVVLSRHIAWRQSAANISSGLYENLLDLVERVETSTKQPVIRN